jgi:flagellar motor switch protein FliN/FliY
MSNLSQEEIDSLLNGENPDVEIGDYTKSTGELDISSYMEEGTDDAIGDGQAAVGIDRPSESMTSFEDLEQELLVLDKSDEYLTHEEKDILGEMGNICMGASATTMYTLLGRRVIITTPQVHVYSSEEVLSVYQSPFVAISVEYRSGVEGKNLLILKENDTIIITDLLMGGEGNVNLAATPIDEMHLSAMSEIMNQMIGSSATSLSNMLGCPIDITPPKAMHVAKGVDVSDLLDGTKLVIKVSFDMEIEGLLKSKLIQLMPVETGKKLAKALLAGAGVQPGAQSGKSAPKKTEEPSPSEKRPEKTQAVSENSSQSTKEKEAPAHPVKVKPYTCQSFDDEERESEAGRSANNPAIDLISDIPLQVAVELGKTKKSINDILNMGIGSIIVLDKMAGELVEVVVNGKQVARGEVVVIDENYGVRITDIVMSHDHIC